MCLALPISRKDRQRQDAGFSHKRLTPLWKIAMSPQAMKTRSSGPLPKIGPALVKLAGRVPERVYEQIFWEPLEGFGFLGRATCNTPRINCPLSSSKARLPCFFKWPFAGGAFISPASMRQPKSIHQKLNLNPYFHKKYFMDVIEPTVPGSDLSASFVF